LLSCAEIASLALITACKKQDAKSHNRGQTHMNAPNVWTSSQVAAPDSVEGQLRAQTASAPVSILILLNNLGARLGARFRTDFLPPEWPVHD
jgi:hypothetical protein